MRRTLSLWLLAADAVIVGICLHSGHPGHYRFALTFALISAAAFTLSIATSRRRS